MNPVETLANEHGLIRQFLDNLTLAASRIEEGQRPSAAFFEKALEFARGFANEYHHFKEEHVLFVQLAALKKGEVDAQLDVLRFQHERCRELLSTIARSVEGYVGHEARATGDLVEALAAYAALLRHHIHLEDHVFYPLAGNVLSAGQMDSVARQFEQERERHGGDAFERSHKLVVDMGSILTHLRQPA
jgi:hemerythrin-like domain-containing protein